MRRNEDPRYQQKQNASSGTDSDNEEGSKSREHSGGDGQQHSSDLETSNHRVLTDMKAQEACGDHVFAVLTTISNYEEGAAA